MNGRVGGFIPKATVLGLALVVLGCVANPALKPSELPPDGRGGDHIGGDGGRTGEHVHVPDSRSHDDSAELKDATKDTITVADLSEGLEVPRGCTNKCEEVKATTCQDAFPVMCDDYDQDGCLEWGPPVPCPQGLECAEGKCVCVTKCDGKACGDDGCGGICGQCNPDSYCDDSGLCQPCGNEVCGGPCGDCESGYFCDTQGLCQTCATECNDVECGPGPCGGDCGACPTGLQCNDGKCTVPCFPVCEGKQCGNDHCCGTCGECSGGTVCQDPPGICVMPEQCPSNCAGKECGDDGCGGECGQCPMNWYCQNGMCVPQCSPQCLVPPGYFVYKQCGWDECPGADGACMGQGVCGACPAGFYCGTGYFCVEDTCSCVGIECGVPSEGCPVCGTGPNDGCAEGLSCDTETNVCKQCQPDCAGKECGDDGCGATCAECPAGYLCVDYVCVMCAPNCLGKECGDNGCGGSCGQCPNDWDCQSGMCVPGQCEAQCMTPPSLLLPMECGPNGCPYGCLNEGSKSCNEMSDCDDGQQCNAVTGMCVPCGSCGTCPAGWICDVSTEDDPELYVCEPCVPNCAGKECGSNGCGGQCGACPAGYVCSSGICVKECEPTAYCFGKQCGPTQCRFDEEAQAYLYGCMDEGEVQCGEWGQCPGGTKCDWLENLCVPCSSCGVCSIDEYCTEEHICEKIPDPCWDKECGPDGSGGSCGECPDGSVCQSDGTCEGLCTPSCAGKECGDDGCGGTCGSCPQGEYCDPTGWCQSCEWSCWGKECGPDPCGGSCGSCSGAYFCDVETNFCVVQCVSPTPVFWQDPDSGQGFCVECANSKDCPEGEFCGTFEGDLGTYHKCYAP